MEVQSDEPVSAAERYLVEQEDRLIAELFEFLRIPSFSAPSTEERAANRPEMERAASWIAARLRAAGVPIVELLPNPDGGPPIVYGRWSAGDDDPTTLIYAHYDTQPAGALELWESPPFEPVIRDGAIYARGASDDKGMLFATIAAVEALARSGGLPGLNLIFCFEGAEETLDIGLADLVRAERDRFACDIVVSADGTMYARDRLSLTVSTKGVCAFALEVQTAEHDFHSGHYGATIPNAAQTIARLVASLHDAGGRVAVAGFYDDVRELTVEARAELAAMPFDPASYLAEVGATAFWGDPEYSPLERAGARPTIDVVGISGGLPGDQIKAVAPGRATAKFSCRLVPDQDPDRIFDLIDRHLERHCPPGATVSSRRLPGIFPFEIRPDHPGLLVAREILREMGGQEPLVQRAGGTLPIAATFQRELGADMVFFAWEMPDARLHAPNEFLRLEDFRTCARAYCRYLTQLADALRASGLSQEGRH